jgi:hypothetical protein
MIKYALACDERHEFDSWFRSAADFDDQAQRGLVECPICRSTAVEKAIMAPSVARRDRNSGGSAPTAPSDGTSQPMMLLDEHSRRLRAAIKDLHEKVAQGSVDVGEHFADQARRMHEGEIPARPIRGRATFDEARSLWESGVPALPIPTLPDEQN